jgi:hypothetical protein
MIATINEEENLLIKVRMTTTEQVDTLLSFLNTIVIKEDDKCSNLRCLQIWKMLI